MIIADAGSSSTTWRTLDGLKSWKTPGYNPNYHHADILQDALAALCSDPSFLEASERLIYYGTGCYRPQPRDKVENMIRACLPESTVRVHSDLLGAAHATCGDEDGLIGILGTGSSLCTYVDGQVSPMSGLGFPLGEECSGYDIVRRILERYKIRLLPPEILDFLNRVFLLDGIRDLDELYTLPRANAVMASYFKKFEPILDHPAIEHLIAAAIEDYYRFQIYPTHKKVPLQLHFVGTVASRISEQLRKYLEDRDVAVGTIITTPLPALLTYYRDRP